MPKSQRTDGIRLGIIRAMKPSEVTPEWVRTRMKARGLRQSVFAPMIGLDQPQLSKTLNGKRDFTPQEREKVIELLADGVSRAQIDPATMRVLEGIQRLQDEGIPAVAAVEAFLNMFAAQRRMLQGDDDPRG